MSTLNILQPTEQLILHGLLGGGIMILFYIDESGTGLGDKGSPYFVLSATGIPAQDWKIVDSQVVALKRRLVSWAKPEDFEIKGRDLRRGEKFFRRMNWPERVKAIHEVAEVIAMLPCRIVAVQVDKRALPDYVASDDMMYRLSLLVEGAWSYKKRSTSFDTR